MEKDKKVTHRRWLTPKAQNAPKPSTPADVSHVYHGETADVSHVYHGETAVTSITGKPRHQTHFVMCPRPFNFPIGHALVALSARQM